MASLRTSIESLLGSSQAMDRVRNLARKAARVRAPVLILGETGTGKSLLGRAIHGESPRAGRPFLAVNCAGIPDSLFEAEFFGHRKGAFTGAGESRPGLLEQAGGGTLFLDELGELNVSNQAKLLTAMEDGEIRPLGAVGVVCVDARIMAATSRDLPADLEDGRFRRDLYHRVAVLTCFLPPLRERPEDIATLATHFVRLHRRRHGGVHGSRGGRGGLTPAAMRYLEGRSWPGNVRQLSHLLEAALILTEGGPLDAEALKEADRMTWKGDREGRAGGEPGSRAGPDSAGARREHGGPGGRDGAGGGRRPQSKARYAFHGSEDEEREIIRTVLRGARGNKSLAARRLGMARNTLKARLRKYGLG